jgi:hypothetical protein
MLLSTIQQLLCGMCVLEDIPKCASQTYSSRLQKRDRKWSHSNWLSNYFPDLGPEIKSGDQLEILVCGTILVLYTKMLCNSFEYVCNLRQRYMVDLVLKCIGKLSFQENCFTNTKLWKQKFLMKGKTCLSLNEVVINNYHRNSWRWLPFLNWQKKKKNPQGDE